jgi:quercetin dioxygenase-like cupin family protein
VLGYDAPGGETELNVKDGTEIMFVIQGSVRVNTPKGSIVMEEGDGGAIPPKIIHSHQDCERGWNQYLVILTPDGPEQEFLGRSTLEKTKVEK